MSNAFNNPATKGNDMSNATTINFNQLPVAEDSNYVVWNFDHPYRVEQTLEIVLNRSISTFTYTILVEVEGLEERAELEITKEQARERFNYSNLYA